MPRDRASRALLAGKTSENAEPVPTSERTSSLRVSSFTSRCTMESPSP